MKNFFSSISNVATTRKFWVAVLGGAVSVLTDVLGESHPAVQLVTSLLTAIAVWTVPNAE